MMVCAAALRAAMSGARTITWWRVGYWVVGSQWLNRESKDGFTTENDCCGDGCRPSRIPQQRAKSRRNQPFACHGSNESNRPFADVRPAYQIETPATLELSRMHLIGL
jgi:hypothetical protein